MKNTEKARVVIKWPPPEESRGRLTPAPPAPRKDTKKRSGKIFFFLSAYFCPTAGE